MKMRANPNVKLSGDRNECPGCGELFNSSAAFDAHRTGKFGKLPEHGGRRCRTVEEMTQRGMEKNAAGFWVTELQPQDATARVRHNATSDFSG
jgi:hypothetical protein